MGVEKRRAHSASAGRKRRCSRCSCEVKYMQLISEAGGSNRSAVGARMRRVQHSGSVIKTLVPADGSAQLGSRFTAGVSSGYPVRKQAPAAVQCAYLWPLMGCLRSLGCLCELSRHLMEPCDLLVLLTRARNIGKLFSPEITRVGHFEVIK